MAIISNVRNDGNPLVTNGPKRANSYNVKPIQVVAVPTTGYALGLPDVANYDFFNAAQTGAATDLIVLQTALTIGTEIQIYCVSACKVVPVSTDTVVINGGTAAQGITMAVGSLYQFYKISATAWICQATTSAGVTTVPTPA